MLLELFTKPAEIFLKEGIEAFKRSAEARNLTLAVRDRIRREVRLNNLLLEEALEESKGVFKYGDELRIQVFRKLSTAAFDEVEARSLPLSLFFDSGLEREGWPRWKGRARYLKHCANDTQVHHLVERTYQRAKVARAFAEAGVLQGDSSYLRFLFACLEKEIREL